MNKKLSDWIWCIDSSKSVGQKDSKIPPRLFLSRSAARKAAKQLYPFGRVIQIALREIKRKR